MAWNDLASNQMVSYTDSTGNPIVPIGSYPSASNQCMTRSNIEASYRVGFNSLASYQSNQLVPKSAWSAFPHFVTWFNNGYSYNTPSNLYIYKNGNLIVSSQVFGYNTQSTFIVYQGESLYITGNNDYYDYSTLQAQWSNFANTYNQYYNFGLGLNYGYNIYPDSVTNSGQINVIQNNY